VGTNGCESDSRICDHSTYWKNRERLLPIMRTRFLSQLETLLLQVNELTVIFFTINKVEELHTLQTDVSCWWKHLLRCTSGN
jgi:hypothetical protein